MLGEGAGPLLHASEEEIADGGAGDAERIDPPVLVEPRVLAADEGLHEVRGDLIVGDDDAVLPHGAAVEGPRPVVDLGALRHLADRREVEGQRPEVVEDPDQHPHQQGGEAQLDQRDKERTSAAPPGRRGTAAFVRGAGHNACRLSVPVAS